MERLSKYVKFQRRTNDEKISRIIQTLETNINMALLQAERIAEGRTATNFPRATPGPDPIAIFNLFADIHFFVVSADNIRKSLRRLDRRLHGALKQILRQYRSFFEPLKKMRNVHEHLDERIDTGQSIFTGKALGEDWSYEMCGASLAVGPPAARVLIEIYHAVEKSLEKKIKA